MEELWNVERVAEHLGLSVRTVYQMARDGRIPSVRLGGRWRFRPKHVEAWLQQQSAGGITPTTETDVSLATGGAPPAPDHLEATLAGRADPLAKRLAFVALLTDECVARGWLPPVVVGGHAVEFYTAGGYATVDIDVVSASEPLDEILGEWGFDKRGRHWLRADLGLVIEAPTGGLSPGQRARVTQVSIGGHTAHVLSVEDLIVDRLSSCVHWAVGDDCRWAETLLVTSRSDLDLYYLRRRANEAEVASALTELLDRTENTT